MSSVIISFFLLVSISAARSLPESNKGLTLIDSDKSQCSAQPLSTREVSIQPRHLHVWAMIQGYFGFSDTRLALVIITLRVINVASIALLVNGLLSVLSIILDNCINLWAHLPPANQVAIEAGNMRLEFGCSLEPVPWDFIAEWASSRRDAVNRGFAPVYAKEWWFDNNDRERLCYVGIRMVPEGAKAERPGKPIH